MQRTELERKLRRGGWIIKPGGKHGMAIHPDKPGQKIPVPNGSKVNDYTAREILKAAGLKIAAQ
jgi:predicted RNA binding protein YcfA (HicA-like mRNA interferase family)